MIRLWIEAPVGDITYRRDFNQNEVVRLAGDVSGVFGLPEPFVSVAVRIFYATTGVLLQNMPTTTNLAGNYYIDVTLPWEPNYYIINAKWYPWVGSPQMSSSINFTVAQSQITAPPPPPIIPDEPEPGPIEPPVSSALRVLLAGVAAATTVAELREVKADADAAYVAGTINFDEYQTFMLSYSEQMKVLSQNGQDGQLPSWVLPVGIGAVTLLLVGVMMSGGRR